jgi:hypothetical protein
MSERPILFSGEMVRAILAGRKTQTRRVARLNASGRVQLRGRQWHVGDPCAILACPYGVAGDQLWVRETWRQASGSNCYHYRADPDEVSGGPWKPSIFMPRHGSRIRLEIAGVRIQRLQEIGAEDAIAEGTRAISVAEVPRQAALSERQDFSRLWDSINSKRAPWDSNPWVWALSFVRVKR